MVLGLPWALGGCGYGASKAAHQAQISMIGMSEADLEACAGPPDKTIALNDAAHILNYVYKPNGTGGLTVDLPLNLGGVSLGGSGTYCTANFRVVAHQVTEVHYSGDNDKTIGSDGVCTPIIRGCLRQPEPTMRPVGGENQPHASAFGPPPVPAQTSRAETITDTPAKK
jgi:hypothetical protein